MHENDISFEIRKAAFKVHTTLGPGLLESVYEVALAHELQQVGLQVLRQLSLPMMYAGVQLHIDAGFRLDLVVAGKVIVEIKSVEALQEVHFKQLLTYLKLSGLKLGQLINFNVVHLKDHMHRLVNGL
ncbi:GxxExxY protein [Hymenobacter weizhouensis]|uniref:GxxExxY protein n=1 Tax=Hymenobacter sp. YIM 151500-1 TaxID=2987689 RepID=UPI002225C90F|nr:GxxExxY protein [Hymenobacter sp. YIM 151500-1]UYZ63436.1 GxxExxY protein [Hymenobacter sp. YIM 151500-1]